MDNSKVVVLGAGTMGVEIALIFSLSGSQVLLLDLPREENSNETLSQWAVEKAKLRYFTDPLRTSALERINTGILDDKVESISQADWIVEAVTERIEIKREILAFLDTALRDDTIVTSNTSGISINKLANDRSKKFKSNFLGCHFFNPASFIPLIELIPSKWTSRIILNQVNSHLTFKLGKRIVFSKDVPNFIVNRFLFHQVMYAIENAIAQELPVPVVDLLCGPWIGRPKTAVFGLVDLIGIDVWMELCNNMGRDIFEYPNSYRVLEQMRESGRLGRKSGSGFFLQEPTEKPSPKVSYLDLQTMDYQPLSNSPVLKVPEKELPSRIFNIIHEVDKTKNGIFQRKLLLKELQRARELVPYASDSIADINTAIKLGLGHQLGPLEIQN